MKLTPDQLNILDHTAHRGAGGRYCGNSKAMQELVEMGLMQSLGRVAWCPDEYFCMTKAGKAEMENVK